MVRVSLLDTLAQGYHSPHRFGRSGNSSSPSGKFLRVAFLWLLTFAVLGLRYRLRAYRFGGRGRSLRALWRSALKLRFVISARLTSPHCFVLYPTARLNLSLYSNQCLPQHKSSRLVRLQPIVSAPRLTIRSSRTRFVASNACLRYASTHSPPLRVSA